MQICKFSQLCIYFNSNYNYRPGGTSVKSSASSARGTGLNSKPTKSPTRCQRLATAATLICGPWCKAAEMGTAHSWHPKEY